MANIMAHNSEIFNMLLISIARPCKYIPSLVSHFIGVGGVIRKIA